ncbi:MAG TPA: hypothetical protein VKU02_15220 [Gemmataceae bacterium]|nr:hypothetical protein [Gemmataceae bacterium]
MISDDATQPIGGTFAGLPDDSTITVTGVQLQINYVQSDSGNSITLIIQ